MGEENGGHSLVSQPTGLGNLGDGSIRLVSGGVVMESQNISCIYGLVGLIAKIINMSRAIASCANSVGQRRNKRTSNIEKL